VPEDQRSEQRPPPAAATGSYRARQSVHLGHHKRHPMHPGSSKRLLQFRPIRPPAAFHFGELANDAPVTAVQVVGNSFALWARAPLLPCRYAIGWPSASRGFLRNRSSYVLYSSGLMRTRADMLRFAIAFALIKARKVVRGLRQGLTRARALCRRGCCCFGGSRSTAAELNG
jgi:hypothetical protein